MAVDMVIKNGTIVLPNASLRTHLIIQDEKIKEMTVFDSLPEARQTIDATGLHVLPGLIDPHVHFRAPGLEYKEDFNTGSQAAAAGGITCVIDMPNVVPPTQDVAGFKAKLACAEGISYVDFGIYAVIVAGNLDQILPLAEAGVVGYKVFMGETVGKIPVALRWRDIGRMDYHARDRPALRSPCGGQQHLELFARQVPEDGPQGPDGPSGSPSFHR